MNSQTIVTQHQFPSSFIHAYHKLTTHFWSLLCRWHPTRPVFSWISTCLSDLLCLDKRKASSSLFKTEVLNLPLTDLPYNTASASIPLQHQRDQTLFFWICYATPRAGTFCGATSMQQLNVLFSKILQHFKALHLNDPTVVEQTE